MKFNQIFRTLFGWHTSKKYIVFESDDWGSFRVKNKKTYDVLSKAGLPLDEGMGYRYNRFDSLETAKDLSGLFDVLHSVSDSKGRPFVITPMALVANPDFAKIKESVFSTYYYNTIDQSYKDYDCGEVLALYKIGIDKGFFKPQFHGREHLNVASWMRALTSGDSMTRLAFDNEFWGFRNPRFKPNFQASYDYHDISEVGIHADIIKDGIDQFTRIFGYKPTHFAPPNGMLSEMLFDSNAKQGVTSYVSSVKNLVPKGNGKYANKYRLPFSKNKLGQTMVMRNCFFEPNAGTQDWVDTCMAEIDVAFKMRVPAIIGNHRTSFMGIIDPSNRDNGLFQLQNLLSKIVKRWPQVEFVSTIELLNIVNKS